MSDPKTTPKDRLDRALADLPAASASPGFTHRVLDALDAKGPPTRSSAGFWALCAAALAAVAIGIGIGARPEPPGAELAAQRESLRQEHGELMRELESLRLLANETRPVLYLGSGDDVDYVLDLSPLVEPRAGTARPAGLAPAQTERPRYY